MSLSYSEIAYALEKSLTKIDAALMKVLESMPPELYADIARSGIFSADRSVADYADTIWHVPYKK